MNNTERLAVLVAMDKAVKEAMRDVRRDADDDLLEAFEEDGYEKKAVKLNGQKVGEHIVTFKSEGYEITDRAAFEEFALDYGMATQRRYISPEFMESAIAALENEFDAETLDGVIVTETVISPDWEKAMERVGDAVCYMDSNLIVPGVEFRPKTVKGTMVRGCKPEDVIPAMRELPGGIEGLLLGGDAA